MLCLCLSCVAPQNDMLLQWSETLCHFITFVDGTPRNLVDKSMFSKTVVGIGYFPTLVPIQVLDCVDSNRELKDVLEKFHAHACYKAAAQALGGTMKGMKFLGQPSIDKMCYTQVHGFMKVANIRGVEDYEGKCSDKSKRVGIFTDGSYFPEPVDKAGGAIVLPSGHVWIFRPRGKQSIYKVELLALTLASGVPFPNDFIWTDSQGCLNTVDGTNPRVLFRSWIKKVRNNRDVEHIMLNYVPGHTKVPGNYIADKYAKLATKLPNNRSRFRVIHGTLW